MVSRSLALAVLLALPVRAEQPTPSTPQTPAPARAATPAPQPIGSGPAASPAQPAVLRAVLRDVKGRSVGKVTLSETPHGVLLRGSLSGIRKLMHALHFHELGKCEPPFKTAGGHFNPTQRAHGALDPSGLHAGDLPNLVVPKSGKLQFELLASAVS